MQSKEMNSIALSEQKICITKLVAAYYYVYSPSFRFPGEKHNCYELVLCDHGEVSVIEENEHFLLTPSEAYLHLPHKFHAISANQRISSVCIILFCCEGEILKTLSGKKFFFNSEQRKLLKNIIQESSAILNGLNESTILKNVKELPFAISQTIKNNLENLLIACLREEFKRSKNSSVSGLEKEEHKNDSTLTTTIKHLLAQNIHSSLTLHEIAFKTGYSVSYITKHFKRQTGRSIIEYFILLKIREATKYILTGKLSIRQISENLGFESVQYFYRQFKKIVRMTPSEYKKSTHLYKIAPRSEIL